VNEAEKLLRPSATDLAAAWADVVRAEREQVERLPNRPRPEDFYAPVAESFRPGAQQTSDPVFDAIAALLRADDVLLDLGAGGGRYAVPLARRVAKVIAVEPSEGMRAVLGDAATREGLENIEIFAERWPGPSKAPVADAGMIVHVAYDIEAIAGFLAQLEAHCRRICIAALFERAPTSDFAPLWPAVHGERRVVLPALPELFSLLFARGRAPAISYVALPPRSFENIEALIAAARRPLWVLEGSEADQRLRDAAAKAAIPFEGGVSLDTRPRRVGIVSWEPS